MIAREKEALEESIRKEAQAEAMYKLIGTSIGVAISPFVVAVALALYLPLFVYVAFVAGMYWGWFVEPTFGLAVPSLWTLTGLVMLVRLLYVRTERRDFTPEEKKVKRGFWRQYLEFLGGVSCFWLLGYVVHLL